MKKRNTMKLWQMLLVVILTALMFVTIFLPAFQINGNTTVKMIKKLMAGEMFEIGGASLDDLKDEVDDAIREAEEEYGIKIFSITPGRIMTHSFDSLLGEDIFNNESKGSMGATYTMIRVILWLFYILAIVVIMLGIFSFCFQWTKYISLAVSAVYGVLVAVFFGIWQFMLPGMLAGALTDQAADAIESLITSIMPYGSMYDMFSVNSQALSSLFTKIFSCFMGIAFLIGFIIAILIVIASVVSMFVGNTVLRGYEEPDGEFWRRQQEEQEGLQQEQLERQRREQFERQRREEQERQQQKQQQKPQTPPMGRVKCTKGVAFGQGFALPEGRKVVVGKSTQNANLIVNYPHVSNVHCSIRYNASTNTYIVKDHSLNGTFVNGVKLQKDVPMTYPAGTVLQLADGENEITLG